MDKLSLRRALPWRNLVTFAPRFAEADRDGLLAALHFASASARAKFATLELVHLLPDLLLSLAAVLSPGAAASTAGTALSRRTAARS